jgi:hypothetical protein
MFIHDLKVLQEQARSSSQSTTIVFRQSAVDHSATKHTFYVGANDYNSLGPRL